MEQASQLGRYQLLERIAQGGMADVFLARSFGVEGFEKRLVIKRIRRHLANDPKLIALFINEARIAVSLNHPNIVQVHELDRVEGNWFIAMEHIHGRDLTRTVRKLRAQGRLLPIPLAVHCIASALRGLAYAHALRDLEGNRHGIVHGDMSPHNLVISFAGEVKVVDFGIARLAGKGWGDDKARPGGGKFAYMSPEQVRGQALDGRSDIYSSGIVLYELLVGHRLYQHPDPEEKLRRVRQAVVPDPRFENPEIPDDLWESLRRALARDPHDRYEKAEAFEEDLRAFLYRHRLRGDANAMASFMAELFADECQADPAMGDLARLAEDLRRLEEGAAQTGEDLAEAPRSGTPPPRSATGTPSWFPASTEELKTVTVLSVEISGNTDLTAGGDPSQIMARHRAWMRWFRSLARRFGGLLQAGPDETYTLIFGVPRTREDDLERALDCALEICDPRNRQGLTDAEAALCVGVNQGEAAVEHAGGNAIARMVGRGDTVKLARRLASYADLDQVRTSQRVAELAVDSFSFEFAAPLATRGEGRIPCWILRGRKSARNLHAGRWLKRADELQRLSDALVALGRNEGRLLVLSGELGLGKGRLIREVLALACRRHLPAYRAQAFPFSDMSLAPFRDLVASITGIEPQDKASELRTKLERLRQLRLSAADISVVSVLFSSRFGTRPPPPSRNQILEVGRRLVRGLTDDGPVMVVLENIHHLDPLEYDLMLQMVRVTRERPLLLLVTTTGGTTEELSRLAAHDIRLRPLPTEALTRLLADRLQAEEVDPALTRMVAAGAAGNPRYTLEMLKALDRAGHLRRKGGRIQLVARLDAMPLPHTLKGLIAARIDELDPASKGVLQVGATIGMRFPLQLLQDCVGEECEFPLRDLQARGLWSLEGSVIEFGSESLWEVARGGLLGERRRETHRLIAAGMRRLYARDLDAHLEALARHEARAGEWRAAAEHLMRSGEVNRKLEFLQRALACYDRALQLYHDNADPQRPFAGKDAEREISLHRRSGEVAQLLGELRRGERSLQVALDLAAEHGLHSEEAATCLALGRLCLSSGRRIEALAYLEQGRGLAEATKDEDLATDSLESLGQLAQEEGRDQEARGFFRAVLERAPESSSVAMRARLGLANHCIRKDELDRALHHLDMVDKAADEAGDRILQGRALNNIGFVHHSRGQYRQALARFKQALQLREGIGYRMGAIINLHNIGDAHFCLGEHPQAYEAFSKSARWAHAAGWRRGITMNQMFLAYLDAKRGDKQASERLIDATQRARRGAEGDLQATGLWLQALLQWQMGDRITAKELVARAVDVARKAGDTSLARRLESMEL